MEELSNEQLVAQIKLGHAELLEPLYERNLPLIRKFIRPYVASRPQEMEDALQEAFIGLWEATRHYDGDAGVKFMTYSKWFIVRAVEKYLYNSTLIRLPQYVYEKISKYKKAYATLTQQHGHPPTLEELSDFTGLQPSELEQLLSLMRGALSLDAEIQTTGGDGDAVTLADVIPSEEELEENVIDALYQSDMRATLLKAIHENLSPREEFVVIQSVLYNRSLRDLAQEANITHERVRQLRTQAIRKLYTHLKDFREDIEQAEGLLYRGGFNTFVNTGESSTERVAIRELEAWARYAQETKLELEVFKKRIQKGA